MKKTHTLFAAAAFCTCLMSFSSFAMTRAEYRDAAAQVKEELRAVTAEITELGAANKAMNADYKTVIQTKKATGTLPIDKADWKEARTLKKEIAAIKQSMPEPVTKEERSAVKAYVKDKNFDAAYDSLNGLLERKRARLDSIRQINDIWNEIDPLIH